MTGCVGETEVLRDTEEQKLATNWLYSDAGQDLRRV